MLLSKIRVTKEDAIGARVLHRASTGDAMKLSTFSVQDHYPDRSRSLPQLYADVIAQARVVRPVCRHPPLCAAADV
ncbi:hypothetical protein CJO77_15215 [Ralstonia solanacearum]|uniref:Uncharacterized protein n=1 Tax=Ralstonia solanacearum TaxID=305 RepID=A0AAD0S945_RALSL|nr:hypothetical protein CJO77_15215 [Ralstonia solanacearum]